MAEKRKLSDVINEKKEKEKADTKTNIAAPERRQGENGSSSRRGKKQIGGHFDPEVSRQLKIAAAKEDKTIDILKEEGFPRSLNMEVDQKMPQNGVIGHSRKFFQEQ
ncbi:hypothetical protein J4G07_22020 [Candidatus Poribacteria bacterium]|nr:hypothetical protein [Candidatus Poribacteria bacterium]